MGILRSMLSKLLPRRTGKYDLMSNANEDPTSTVGLENGLVVDPKEDFIVALMKTGGIDFSAVPITIRGGSSYIQTAMRNSEASSLFTKENIFALENGETKNIHMILALLKDEKQKNKWIQDSQSDLNVKEVIKCANSLQDWNDTLVDPRDKAISDSLIQGQKRLCTQLFNLQKTVSKMLLTAEKTSVLIDDSMNNILAIEGKSSGVFYDKDENKFYALTTQNIIDLRQLRSTAAQKEYLQQNCKKQCFSQLSKSIEALGLTKDTCTLCCDFDQTITKIMTANTLQADPLLNESVVHGLRELQNKGYNVNITTRNTRGRGRKLNGDEEKKLFQHIKKMAKNIAQYDEKTQYKIEDIVNSEWYKSKCPSKYSSALRTMLPLVASVVPQQQPTQSVSSGPSEPSGPSLTIVGNMDKTERGLNDGQRNAQTGNCTYTMISPEKMNGYKAQETYVNEIISYAEKNNITTLIVDANISCYTLDLITDAACCDKKVKYTILKGENYNPDAGIYKPWPRC